METAGFNEAKLPITAGNLSSSSIIHRGRVLEAISSE
jgi:hypothetical protein